MIKIIHKSSTIKELEHYEDALNYWDIYIWSH